MSLDPHQVAEPGYGIDYRIGNDDSGYPTVGGARGWRRPSIPVAEDGTIPSVSLLAEAEVGHTLVTTEQVDVSFHNPIYPSTYDIPNNEME